MTRSYILLITLATLIVAFFGIALIIACGDDDDDERTVPYVPADDDTDDDVYDGDDDVDDDVNDDVDDDNDDDVDDDNDDDVNDDGADDDCDDVQFQCPWGYELDEPYEGANCYDQVCNQATVDIILYECPNELNPDGLSEDEAYQQCYCLCDNGCVNECVVLAYQNHTNCEQLQVSLTTCIQESG